MYPDAAEELLKGCTCGSHFFYYIRKDLYNQAKQHVQEKIEQFDSMDKKQVEKDVREIMGIEEKDEIPVILDLESVRILEPGKYEIDIVNLFSEKRPLVYKLEEGKYIIDLASTIKANAKEISKKIKSDAKKILNKIFRVAFILFIAYLIFELIRKILGGSLGFEEIVVALLVANLTFSFYLKDSINKVESKLFAHRGWHRGMDERRRRKK